MCPHVSALLLPVSDRLATAVCYRAGIRYTGLMRKEIEGNPCERNGVDQGMHNVFVHGRRLTGSETVILTNEEGPIATVQSMKQLHRDKYGRLLNRDGACRARVSVCLCVCLRACVSQ